MGVQTFHQDPYKEQMRIEKKYRENYKERFDAIEAERKWRKNLRYIKFLEENKDAIDAIQNRYIELYKQVGPKEAWIRLNKDLMASHDSTGIEFLQYWTILNKDIITNFSAGKYLTERDRMYIRMHEGKLRTRELYNPKKLDKLLKKNNKK